MARQDTKTLTYTIQYGGGINRISTVFGVSAERAGQIRENFYLSYPGFRAKANIAQSKARAKGKLRLWSGRYRHFLYPQDEAHKGFNSIIQGGAADIVERTMVRLFNTVDHEEECRMLLQVHDSIVFEIKNGLESKYLPMIKKCMENVEPDFGVRFAVDIHKWGTEESWNEAA
jgi:DNA polymerase-1